MSLNYEYWASEIVPTMAIEVENTKRTIGLIGTSVLHDCLSHDFIIKEISYNNWESQVSNSEIDFLLVESSFNFAKEKWNNQLESVTVDSNIVKLLKFCKENEIPTVFWLTKGKEYTFIFSEVAKLFSKVYCSDEKSIANFREIGIEASLLEHAVQPALHNPYNIDLATNNCSGDVIYDGWSDLLENPHILLPFLMPISERLSIIDSSWILMSNKLNDIDVIRSSVAGCVTYRQCIQAMKSSKIYLDLIPTLRNEEVSKRRALEAICCGATVLSNRDDNNVIKLSGRSISETIQGTSISSFIEDFEENFITYKIKNHQLRRWLYLNHTYLHRMNSIYSDLGKKTEEKAYPKVSVVSPTKRPHLIETIISNYKAQRYDNKELIIILNTTNTEAVAKTKNYVKDVEDVKLIVVHEGENIGTCLNAGIRASSGELWFKMDDDDFYGGNYISDMVEEWMLFKPSVFGKSPAYIYFESIDSTYIKNSEKNAYSINCSKHICGATISGTKNINRRIPFSTNRRANVDSTFISECRDKNEKMLISDNFNFIIYRGSDLSSHTWRITHDELLRGSKCVCNGLSRNLLDV